VTCACVTIGAAVDFVGAKNACLTESFEANNMTKKEVNTMVVFGTRM
jgi:hypothetical protein